MFVTIFSHGKNKHLFHGFGSATTHHTKMCDWDNNNIFFWISNFFLNNLRLFNCRTFLATPKENLYLTVVTLYSPCPQSPVACNLVSVPTDFPVLNIGWERNHVTYDLLYLVSLTQHNVCKTHPCCNMYECFIPFYGWVIFHSRKECILFSIHLLIDIELHGFRLL